MKTYTKNDPLIRKLVDTPTRLSILGFQECLYDQDSLHIWALAPMKRKLINKCINRHALNFEFLPKTNGYIKDTWKKDDIMKLEDVHINIKTKENLNDLVNSGIWTTGRGDKRKFGLMYIKHPKIIIDGDYRNLKKLDWVTKMSTNVFYSDRKRAELEHEKEIKEYNEAIEYLATGSLFKVYGVIEENFNLRPIEIPTCPVNAEDEIIFINHYLIIEGEDEDMMMDYKLNLIEDEIVKTRLIQKINEL